MKYFDTNEIAKASDEELLDLLQSIGVDVHKLTAQNRNFYEQKMNEFFKRKNIHFVRGEKKSFKISKEVIIFVGLIILSAIYGIFKENLTLVGQTRQANFATEEMGASVFGIAVEREGSLPSIFENNALKSFTDDPNNLINVSIFLINYYQILKFNILNNFDRMKTLNVGYLTETKLSLSFLYQFQLKLKKYRL
jgi:hypothetical protein